MCQTGGPYCYKDTIKVARNAKKRLEKNNTPENRKKFAEAIQKVDSSAGGQKKLAEDIQKETDPQVKKNLEKRLAVGQKAHAEQKAKRKAERQKMKENSFKAGYSVEAAKTLGEQVSDYKYNPNREANEDDKHIISEWAANHGKDGKYIYKSRNHVPEVVTHDNQMYYRVGTKLPSGGELYPENATSFRIQVNKKMDPETAQKFGKLIQNTYGELEDHDSGGGWSPSRTSPVIVQDSPNSVIVNLDTQENNMSSKVNQFVNNVNEDYSRSSLAGSNPKIEIYANETEEYNSREDWDNAQSEEEENIYSEYAEREDANTRAHLNSWYMRNN